MKNKIDLQRIYAVTVLTMLLCFGMAYARADTPPKPPDQLMCEALFKDHVLGGFKMPERDNRAALQVLADTARRNGFWHIVLSEIEKEDSKPSPKRACAIVLGKVLQEDGWTRDVLKRQKEPAQIPYEVFLSDSEKGKIVDALLSCLLQTSHEKEREAFILALAQARDSRTSEALAGCLRSTVPVESQFYAAVGLSNLGDPRGYRFLVEHSESGRGNPDLAGTPLSSWPENAVCRSLDGCCRAALQTLTGNEAKKSGSQNWESWWAGKHSLQPVELIFLRD